MFAQILNQVRNSKLVGEFVLNTSSSPQDDELVQYAEKLGLKTFRGPVDDIVTRLWGALSLTDSEYLVRIWGDCPFVCPDVIDHMITVMINENLDFIHNSEFQNRTYPPGLDVEIYRRGLLKTMNAEVQDAALREFPVEFVKKSKSRFSMKLLQANEDLSNLHLTVDYPEDMEAADKLISKLHSESSFFTYPQLCKYLKNPIDVAGFSKAARNIEYQKYLNESGKK